MPTLPRLALLCVVGLTLACSPSETSAPRPDQAVPEPAAGPRTVVLVSLDTLRPGRLGVYGGPGDVSPVIDRFASEAVVFDQALAASPWTLPSHMTMLTGLDPVAHGVINEGYGLSPKVTTLAEAMAAGGFTTAAFTDGGYVSGKYGFSQGFGVYNDQRNDSPDGVNGFPRIMPLALSWLEQQQDQDVFLFLHTFDAHTPYDEVAPEILERFRSRPVHNAPKDHELAWAGYLYKQVRVGVNRYGRLGDLINDYDAGVFEADLWLGRLFDELRAEGRYRDAVILVTSDHGESFFDHDLHVGHGLTLTDDEVHVPLILRLPRGEGAGRRIDTLVGLVDVTRTLLDLAGAAADDAMQGESLAGLVRGRPRRLDFVLGFSQNTRNWSLVKNGYKYITPVGVKPMLIAERHLGPMQPPSLLGNAGEHVYTLEDQELRYDMAGDPLGLLDVLPSTEQLYDRRADPDELHDLVAAGEQTDVLKRMRENFAAEHSRSKQLAGRFQTEEVTLDASEQRVLASLGYLESGNRSDLKGVSRTMREWVLNPHRAPDTHVLLSADQSVHRLRVRLAAGEAASANDARVLSDAGEAYLAWAAEHPTFGARADWRLAELVNLAQAADIELPVQRWLADLEELPR